MHKSIGMFYYTKGQYHVGYRPSALFCYVGCKWACTTKLPIWRNSKHHFTYQGRPRKVNLREMKPTKYTAWETYPKL